MVRGGVRGRGRGRGRGRPRVSRMDAAVDAMLPYGFEEGKVKNQVRELLEVYGGDDGWPFIEEFAYKVLIESLLGDDEEEQVVQNGDPLEDGEAGSPAIMEPPGAAVAEPKPANKRTRGPCYGWIDSDEDDGGDDFILLIPASPALGPGATRSGFSSTKWTKG